MYKIRKKITHKERSEFALIAFIFGAKIFLTQNLHFFLLAFSFFSFKTVFAQDLRFTQFHASDTWVNPAFAGIKGQPRLEVNFRDQWPSIPQTYVSYRIAFDATLSEINSGVGLFITKDDEGQNVLKTMQMGVQYNYQLQLAKNLALNAGMQATYIQKSVDWNELQFYDQIDPIYGFTDASGNPNPTSQIQPANTKLTFTDFAASALLFSSKWYVGLSAAHLTQPEQSFYSENSSKLPMSVTLQTGLLFYNDQKLDPIIINPLALFTVQKDYKQLMAGSYFKLGNLLGGVFSKYNMQEVTDVSGLIGLRKGWMTFAYSYDVPLGSFSGESGGAHEVSVVVLFEPSSTKMKTKRQKHALDCPGIL
jgi:type IX secretion system PorP/SprF family membrane protein